MGGEGRRVEGWRGTVGRGYLKISFILFFCSAAVSKSIRMLAGGGEGMENDFLLSNLIRHFYFFLGLSFLVDKSKLDYTVLVYCKSTDTAEICYISTWAKSQGDLSLHSPTKCI